jgi:hypothetical protein
LRPRSIKEGIKEGIYDDSDSQEKRVAFHKPQPLRRAAATRTTTKTANQVKFISSGVLLF